MAGVLNLIQGSKTLTEKRVFFIKRNLIKEKERWNRSCEN